MRKNLFKVFLMMLLIPLIIGTITKKDVFAAKSEDSDQKRVDSEDVKVVPLQVTGPTKDRLNLIIFGDGYTAEEMDKFRADVDRNQNVQWSVEPFRSYRNYFNVYMVETPSKDSGISCDPDDGNVRRDTVFNLQYANNCPADELARGVTFGQGGAETRDNIIEKYIAPELDIPHDSQNIQTLTIGNTFTYGGIGGVHATTTGGSPQGPLVSLHELGHSLGNLADEYSYYDRGVPGDHHPDQEPNSFHHTRMTSEEMIAQKAKWWRWLGEESESGGIIRGADSDGYEGGQYRKTNIWRPSNHSMMRHTGFYFDQIGREQMTQRITGMRDAGNMPLSSTPEGEIGKDEVISVNTMYPRFHLLDVTWEIDGNKIEEAKDLRHLDLSKHDVKEGDVIKVTVQDKTDFVRDPDYLDGPRMTQSRQWVVGEPLNDTDVDITFTNHSTTSHALAFNEIAFVETPNPTDRILNVTWKLDDEILESAQDSRFLDLSKIDLTEGTFTLSATVSDPNGSNSDEETVTWTVDNRLPTAPKELTEPIASLDGDSEHFVYFNEFEMKLEPEDDQPGFVVGELRLNKDGWYNYFGFPDEPEGTPFKFSHSGTDIKELTYGNLGKGGLSIATFEREFTEEDPGGKFIPGFDTHLIEHRAIDAAGNIGKEKEFLATVIPGEELECLHKITDDSEDDLIITEQGVCLDSVTVKGDLIIKENASVSILNSTVTGDIKAEKADIVQIINTEVNGHTNISETQTDVTLIGNSFNGWLILMDNNQLSTNDQYGDYGPILVGNDIDGGLGCFGNNSDIADFGAPNTVNQFKVGDCSDEEISIKTLKDHIEKFGELDAFKSEKTERVLNTHLVSLELFEKEGNDSKVIKHLEGLNTLLSQWFEEGLIEEYAYEILLRESLELSNEWE